MAERGILLVQPEHVVSLKLMNVEEQIRKIHTSTVHQKTIYEHTKIASSLRSVRIDRYMLVTVDAADYRPPDTGRQPCGQHISIAEAIAKPLGKKGHRSS